MGARHQRIDLVSCLHEGCAVRMKDGSQPGGLANRPGDVVAAAGEDIPQAWTETICRRHSSRQGDSRGFPPSDPQHDAGVWKSGVPHERCRTDRLLQAAKMIVGIESATETNAPTSASDRRWSWSCRSEGSVGMKPQSPSSVPA